MTIIKCDFYTIYHSVQTGKIELRLINKETRMIHHIQIDNNIREIQERFTKLISGEYDTIFFWSNGKQVSFKLDEDDVEMLHEFKYYSFEKDEFVNLLEKWCSQEYTK